MDVLFTMIKSTKYFLEDGSTGGSHTYHFLSPAEENGCSIFILPSIKTTRIGLPLTDSTAEHTTGKFLHSVCHRFLNLFYLEATHQNLERYFQTCAKQTPLAFLDVPIQSYLLSFYIFYETRHNPTNQ